MRNGTKTIKKPMTDVCICRLNNSLSSRMMPSFLSVLLIFMKKEQMPMFEILDNLLSCCEINLRRL